MPTLKLTVQQPTEWEAPIKNLLLDRSLYRNEAVFQECDLQTLDVQYSSFALST